MAIRKQKSMFNKQFYFALGVLIVVLMIVQMTMRSAEQSYLVNGTPLYGEDIKQLPEAVSNNGIAKASVNGKTYLFSFSGITAGKQYTDITSNAYMLELGSDNGWVNIGPLPDKTTKHRLASVAMGIGESVFVFGGYTVAADGSEVSTPETYKFNVPNKKWQRMADIPTPVDDSVAVTYQNRYIYLISGWHDGDNVSLTQVYDSQNDTWARATDYPGSPVFGHAGGIVGNKMVIADGAMVIKNEDENKFYGITNEVYMGVINPDDHLDIHWRRVTPHPNGPTYRVAAVGSEKTGRVIFAGGTDNPYNYSGIGYDKHPSRPSTAVFSYDVEKNIWIKEGNKPIATMDHRGLLEIDEKFYIIGGMTTNQEVSDKVSWFRLSAN